MSYHFPAKSMFGFYIDFKLQRNQTFLHQLRLFILDGKILIKTPIKISIKYILKNDLETNTKYWNH